MQESCNRVAASTRGHRCGHGDTFPKAAPAARVWLAPSSELLPCHKMQTAQLYLTLYRRV